MVNENDIGLNRRQRDWEILGIVNLDENQEDLEQGNKLAVLGGDYLLSQACGKLADFRKPEVRSKNCYSPSKNISFQGCRNYRSCHCRNVQSRILSAR